MLSVPIMKLLNNGECFTPTYARRLIDFCVQVGITGNFKAAELAALLKNTSDVPTEEKSDESRQLGSSGYLSC